MASKETYRALAGSKGSPGASDSVCLNSEVYTIELFKYNTFYRIGCHNYAISAK